jgi:hypothetical protein
MRKVEWYSKPRSLSEEYQQTGMQFAFVSAPKDGYKACHEWVLCRDFLQDAVKAQLTGKNFNVYGFCFKPGTNPPVDLKKMRMLVTKGTIGDNQLDDFEESMKCGLEMLHYYERLAGWTLSRLKKVDATDSGKKVVYMFTSSAMWLKSPVFISLHTLLIRLGYFKISFSKKEEAEKAFLDFCANIDCKDKQYAAKIKDHIERIIKERNKLFPLEKGFHDIFFKELGTSNFHHYSGVVSLVDFRTADTALNERAKKILQKKG